MHARIVAPLVAIRLTTPRLLDLQVGISIGFGVVALAGIWRLAVLLRHGNSRNQLLVLLPATVGTTVRVCDVKLVLGFHY